MDFSRIAEVIKKDSPLISSVISTANPVAGILVNSIMTYFGVNNPASLPAAISSDPDAAIKLKQIEEQHSEELNKISLSDKESARERELKVIELTGKRDWILDILAIIFIVFFFVICCLSFFYDIKEDHVMLMLIGQISAGVGLILAYYFGSSNK